MRRSRFRSPVHCERRAGPIELVTGNAMDVASAIEIVAQGSRDAAGDLGEGDADDLALRESLSRCGDQCSENVSRDADIGRHEAGSYTFVPTAGFGDDLAERVTPLLGQSQQR